VLRQRRPSLAARAAAKRVCQLPTIGGQDDAAIDVVPTGARAADRGALGLHLLPEVV
jgi:hypothetical protein